MQAMPMILPALPQPAGLPAPPPEAALAQLARAALGLVQSAGQPVPALVVGPMAGGLTQLQIGEMLLAVRLSTPLAAGTAVKLAISTDSKGQPGLQVTPVVAGAATGSAQPVAPVAAALPAVAQAVAPVQPAPRPTPELPPQASTAAVPASPRPPTAVPAPMAAAGVAASAPAVPGAPMAAAPVGTAATVPDVQELAQGGVRVPAPGGGPIAVHAAPTAVVTPSPNSPAAQVVPATTPGTGAVAPPPTAGVTRPAPTAVAAEVLTAAKSSAVPPPPVAANGGGAPALAAASPPVAPLASGSSLPTASGPVAAQQPSAQVTGQPPMGSAVLGSKVASPVVVAKLSFAPVQTGPSQAAVVSGQAAPAATAQAGVAMAIPYRAVPAGPVQAAAPALPLAQVLADPAQAAARQNSIVPLLARLAALGPQLNALPIPAAQAALRLLAMRLDVGGLDGKALQAAVATAGVLARPAAGAAATAPSLKSALLQLRGGLAGVPGAEIEAVTAIAGRPHPPVRGDEPRTVRAELPLPMAGEEPARGLLSQTDAALSRLKLLQHASQPPEARPGTAAQQELRVEVPLLIGAQTALLQLVVDRDARRRDRPGERGWRMRFAFASQQTGEVGAEVALFGPSVSVALWADTLQMETAMADGLDELRAALAAEGLEAGSVRVRRRVAAPSQQPGTLMDSAR